MTCASCGRENPEANRFCGQCAAPLETAARAESEDRRVVTIVFADLEGSTALGERLDPEALRDVQSRYFAAMRGPLIAHGGTIEKYIGDAVMAVFGIPALHEDDALRAVRAAIEMQDAMAELNRELERDLGVGIALRIGVNTGEVAGIDGGLIAGDAVNTAARLQAGAPAGGVVIGRHTRRLVESSVRLRALGRVVVKGKARPLPIWQVDSLVETAGSTVRGALVPLVGRRIELRMMNTRFARAVERQRCVLVTVSGPAGIGKSRLLKEFAAAVEPRAAVAVGRCLPYGEGITYWPLIEIVNSLTGNAGSAGLTDLLADDPQRQVVASRLAAVVGGRSGAATEQDVQWGITRLFDALARRGPLVIMFDDIHWAEQAMLDLVEHVSEHSSAPVLIVCSAREELFERRPQWARAGGRASVIRLEPLLDRELPNYSADSLFVAGRRSGGGKRSRLPGEPTVHGADRCHASRRPRDPGAADRSGAACRPHRRPPRRRAAGDRGGGRRGPRISPRRGRHVGRRPDGRRHGSRIAGRAPVDPPGHQ